MRPLTTNYYYVKLLWAGIGEDTRARYNTAVRSYENFCGNSSVAPWPATRQTLAPWIVTRAWGAPFSRYLGQVSGSTLSGYISSLRSVHVDLDWPVDVFECPHIRRLLAGAHNLFPKRLGQAKLPITRELLNRLLCPEACLGESATDTLNLNAAFALAFSAFLRMGEFMWKQGEPAQRRQFAITRLTRRCITINSDYMEFFLPRSKTDKQKEGVTIMVAYAEDGACAPTHLRRLFSQVPRAANDPLFELSSGTFTRNRVLNALNKRLANLGLQPGALTGHSFRKGATQRAHDMEVPTGEIQYMGRWASDSIERYYRRSRSHQLRIQRLFQTGRTVGFATTGNPLL